MSKKHFRLSPSGTSRWLHCTKSLELCEGLPSTSSSYADEGTQAHDLAERLLRGEKLSVVDKEMLAAVKVYVDLVESYRRSKTVHFEYIEKMLESEVIPGLGGTSDCVLIYTDTDGSVVLHIIDYKHGAGYPVDAVENMQLLSYFAIWRSAWGFIIDKYRGTIVQPRADGDDVKDWETTAERILEHEAQILEALGKEPVFHVGEGCRWCRALSICPAVHEQAKKTAQEEFSDLVSDKQRILEIYKILPALKALCDKIPTAMLDVFKSGDSIEGMKVIERMSHRRWALGQEATFGALETLGLSKDEFLEEPELKSPAQVEKLLKGKDKKAIGTLVKQVVVGYKVVPTSAKGEPVDLTGKDDFEVFEEEENG